MNLNLDCAGIVIALDQSRRIRIYDTDAKITIRSNFKGAFDPQMPDGYIIEIALGLGGTRDFVEELQIEGLL